jgi:prepilin-type processing-associated H-X9-DG protein
MLNATTGSIAEGSVFFACLPFFEETNLFNAYTQDQPNAGYLGAQPINLVLFGAGGSFNIKGASSPYRYGKIPDGTSKTICMTECGGCFPAYPSVDPQSGTLENWMSWPYPAYTNTLGCYWPNPDELPGQPSYVPCTSTTGYALPQIGTNTLQANPNLCQSYHPTSMNIAMMDGSVRQINEDVSQQNWNYALDPADNHVPDGSW